MKLREYQNYQEYLKHQARKGDEILKDYRNRGKGPIRHSVFCSQFTAIAEVEEITPGKVLCLGARYGEEVRAWRSLGYDAIGVDINPGPKNPYVIHGDFHNLPWGDESFDYIWSNAMDHSIFLDKASAEALRVLKPGGKAFFEVKQHVESSVKGDEYWEAVFWENQNEIVQFYKNLGTWKSVEYRPFRFFIQRGIRLTLLDRPYISLEKGGYFYAKPDCNSRGIL